MKGDIGVIRVYFEYIIDVFPSLGRVIENKFEILDSVVELTLIAARSPMPT